MEKMICLILLIVVGFSIGILTIDEIRTNRKMREWCENNRSDVK